MTTETISSGELISELKAIRQDLDLIKAQLVDADSALSADEKKMLDESLIHEKEGKLVSLEEIEHARTQVRKATE